MNTRISRLIVLLLIVLGTVGCDQTTKHFARAVLSDRPAVNRPGGMGKLVLAQNEGGHLSFGATWSQTTRTVCFIFVAGTSLLALGGFLIVKPGLGADDRLRRYVRAP
jgi:signal peptidase II